MATSLNALSLIIGMNTDQVMAGVNSIRQQMGRASRIMQMAKTATDRLNEGTKALTVSYHKGAITQTELARGLAYLDKRFGEAARKARELKDSIQQSNAALPAMASNIAAVAASFLSFQGAKSFFGAAIEIEKATLAFQVYTGSAEKAADMVKELQRLDRESPLGAMEVNRAAEMMLAYGINTEKVIPTLEMLANVAGGSAERFGRLGYAMSQVLGLGRLTGMELRQLNEAGFNPLQIAMEQTGKSQEELTKLMSDGAFTAQMVMDALASTTTAGGTHFGFMEKYAASTAGALSLLRSSATLFAADFGSLFLPAVDKSARALVSLLDGARDLGKWFSPLTRNAILFSGSFLTFIAVVPRVVAAFRAIGIAIRGVLAAQITLQAVTGPKGMAVVAAGLAVAAGAVWSANKALDAHNKSLEETADAQKELASGPVAFAFDDIANSVREADKTVHNMLQGYRDQNLDLIKGAEWMEQYRAIQAGATDKQLEELAMLRQRNSMLQMAKELEERRQQAVEQRQKDRIEDSKKYVQDLERDAQRVRESIQTPFQAAANSIARLMQLLQGGFINSAQYAKALMQEVSGMREQMKPHGVAALDLGSQDTYARITGQMVDRDEAKLKKLEEQRLIAAAQLKAQQEANRLARNMTTVARIR